MTDTEEGQNNPPLLHPSASSSAGLGEPRFSLPALNRPIHQECAGASMSSVASWSTEFQRGAGCENSLLCFAAAARRVCACLKHSESVCRRCFWVPGSPAEPSAPHWKTKAGEMCLSPSARTLLCEELAQPPAEPPPGFLTHTAQSAHEFESTQPPGFVSLHPFAPAANKGANSPQLLERCSCTAWSATCKCW